MNLLWGYLAVGFLVALIYAVFFTRIIILKKISSEKNNCEIHLEKVDKSLYILHFERFFIVFTDIENEVLFNGFNNIFQLKLGLLFLVSGLIWPIFLIVLILILCVHIFGKQLSAEPESKEGK